MSSEDPNRIRLNSLDRVKITIDKTRAPFVVLKPLVESQNTCKLLDYFSGSRAVWMFRDYQDVVRSSLKHFQSDNSLRDLRPIVENDLDNWRSDAIPDEIREVVLKHFDESMEIADAAALFWWVRNKLFFSQMLGSDSRVRLCLYDDFVERPEQVMRKIYAMVGQDFPGPGPASMVTNLYRGKGGKTAVSPAIAGLCDTLLADLLVAYRAQESAD